MSVPTRPTPSTTPTTRTSSRAAWLAGEGDRGVLVCGTGIGMSIAANRHAGIRAALCHDAFTAETARRHNDANVLCLGGRTTGAGVALQILELFLTVAFDGGRHERRVEKVESLHGSPSHSSSSDVHILLKPKE